MRVDERICYVCAVVLERCGGGCCRCSLGVGCCEGENELIAAQYVACIQGVASALIGLGYQRHAQAMLKSATGCEKCRRTCHYHKWHIV